jgi:hypothetical protein
MRTGRKGERAAGSSRAQEKENMLGTTLSTGAAAATPLQKMVKTPRSRQQQGRGEGKHVRHEHWCSHPTSSTRTQMRSAGAASAAHE